MKKDLHFPYSILNSDIICEHKTARIDDPDSFALHNHDGYEIVLFLNGDVSIFVESEERKLEVGNLAIIPPYVFHGMRIADIDEYERIVLNLRPGVIKEISDDDTDFFSALENESTKKMNLISLHKDNLTEAITLLSKLEDTLSQKSFGHTVLAKAYLIEFLVFIAHYTKHHTTSDYENNMSPVVKKIFKCIDDNSYNELNVEKLAKELHHNCDYLERVFKKTTGSTLKYYINAKKIALAQGLLREGNSPYDVCFMLGFNNYSSFSRCFSQHIGLSPQKYVLSLRK